MTIMRVLNRGALSCLYFKNKKTVPTIIKIVIAQTIGNISKSKDNTSIIFKYQHHSILY